MARSNDAAAQMLQEFAELLAISGGDAFKVRAYEKAARVVAGYRSEIAGLDEKGLDAIPSVGSHLARKIIEFGDTGSVEELDELRAAVPAGLRTLLAVPGLGPKRARQVYDQMGITSVSELLDALHDERLRGLRGWGVRSETNLAEAIHDTRIIGHRSGIDVDFDAVFEAAARTGTALEINSFPDRLDLDDELIRRARYAGVRFAVSTDAHAVPHLDYLRFGIATAQRGWAEKEEVINAYPLTKLRRFLHGKETAWHTTSR